MLPEKSVTISKKALSQVIDGQVVILGLEKNAYFGLDKVGAFIWEKLKAGLPVQEVVTQVSEIYQISKEIAAEDIDSLLAELEDAKLISVN